MKKIFKITSEQLDKILEHHIGKNPINEAFANQGDAVSANVSNNQIYLNLKIDDKDGKEVVGTIFSKLRKNSKTGSYFLTAPLSAKDSFLGGAVLGKILNFLSQKGYKVPTVDELKAQTDDKATKASIDPVTPEDKANAKEKYDDLIVKILTNLNNPDIQNLISNISRFRIMPDITDSAFGHIFSAKNALRALAQKPDATFLATRNQWETKYNREVKPGATKVILFVNIGGGDYDASKAEKSLGVTKDVAYQSAQMQHKFDITAKSEAGSSFTGMPKAYYDISDTVLIPGADNTDGDLSQMDKLANQPGLMDNIRGILNQAAIDMKGVSLSPEDKAKIGAKDTSNKNVTVFSKILNSMRLEPEFKGLTDQLIKLDPHDDMSVLKVIKEYFMNVSFGRASSDRELKTNIATTGILAMTQVAPTALAQLLKTNETTLLSLTKGEFSTVFDQVMALDRIITAPNVVDTSKGVTNESDELNERSINSPEDLINLFGHTMNDLKDGDSNKEDDKSDAIMNEFYNVYNKINNTINEHSNFRRKI
jgi:hypothetical protein